MTAQARSQSDDPAMRDSADATFAISIANDRDQPRWDQFVLNHPHSSFFHRFGWADIINQAYGYAPYYLYARNETAIIGVLPLIFVNSPLTGKALIATAFTVGGGIIADDPLVARALASRAVALGMQLGVQYVELRGTAARFEDWQTKQNVYAGFEMPIAATPDAILTAIPRKRRAELRKSLALVDDGALSICEKADPARFFKLYSHGLRDLGTPVFPKKFLSKLVEKFGTDIGFITILHHAKPVVGLLSFYHRDKVMPYYVGALPAARGVRAFDLIYWHQLLVAAQRGIGVFDFGRSKIDTGSFGYKKTWGIEPAPLAYQYFMIKASQMPDINPNNPKFALATRVWRKLPVPLATIGGSIVARHFA